MACSCVQEFLAAADDDNNDEDDDYALLSVLLLICLSCHSQTLLNSSTVVFVLSIKFC